MFPLGSSNNIKGTMNNEPASNPVHPARALWMRFETIHAVTYFGAESAEAAKAIGLDSWWKGYFAFRGAPFGHATAGIYDAAFHSFSLPFVRRWVPAIWESTTPEIALLTRSAAAASTLRRCAQVAGLDLRALVAEANPALEEVLKHCFWSGRPVFAANRDVALPVDPVERLWQLCTSLREHRGDGHVVASTAAALSGLEAHVLIAVEQQNSFDDLARTRGWSTEEWNDCLTGLQQRGLVNRSADWGLTGFGEEMRRNIETMTDQLATQPFNPRTSTDLAYGHMASVTATLDPLARVVAQSGTIRYPNPMGLPTVLA
jgi:hypothetical protein